MDKYNSTQPISGIEIIEQGTDWSLSASTRSPLSLFYIPFMLLWSSFMIVALSKGVFIDGHLSLIGVIFALPFFLAGLLFWWIAALLTAGAYRISVNNAIATLFIGVGRLGLTRTFAWTDIQKIEEIDNYINRRQLGFNQRKIQMSGMRTYRFGMLLNDEQRLWLILFLQTKLSP